MTSFLAQGELKVEFVSPLVVYGNELYCSCPAFRSAEFEVQSSLHVQNL